MLENTPKLWTRNFILICLANLLVLTSFYILFPTLPVFIVRVLKGDESDVGYIIGVLSLTAVLVRPLAGFLFDAVGRKKILVLAVIGFSLVMVSYNLVTSLALLFALRALHGFTWGFTNTGSGTVASDVVPPQRRGEGLGYYGMSNTLAMAAGPGLGMYIISLTGFTQLFNMSFALAIAGSVCILAISYPENRPQKKAVISLESFFEPKVLSLYWIIFFTAVVYGGIMSFVTLYGEHIGIKNAGTYFLAYAVTLLITRPLSGRYYDRKGPAGIMAAGFISIALSFVILFASKGLVMFLLSAATLGIGYGIVQPTTMAIIINRVAPFRRGAANSTYFSGIDLGMGLGSIMLGFLSKKVGLSYMYLSCSLIILIPMVLFYLKEARVPHSSPQ
ncbi:MAG: MFS transporter [Actinobacteria bacterium]|nr:MFS transporter [Actinomycetota bacterium]